MQWEQELKQGRKLEVGADTKDIEKYGLLDCFSWLIQTVFL